ncbi:hypothetical protein SUVZ_06G1100 [Saccharomyces uvarum]|uniref:Uncharacterized protein n=1 Tax=Saccharomyces uvarum TaxID=230603 RepID=A0ABN8WSK9_SACUV|nr:hypothetical protein SUVZ_06G1100 [Saccharomyces uvarum]
MLQQNSIASAYFSINGTKPWNANFSVNIKGSFYMYTGYFYPMKVVYWTAVSRGTLPISMILQMVLLFMMTLRTTSIPLKKSRVGQLYHTRPLKYISADTITSTTESRTGAYTTSDAQTSTITGRKGLPMGETVIEVKTPTSVSSSSVPPTEVTTKFTTSPALTTSKSSESPKISAAFSTIIPRHPMNKTVVTSPVSSTLATFESSILLESSRSPCRVSV